ncbi:class I SAM-dependent methyltransferase [Polynucleobacter sp. MWH-Berg-3C6]|uniref:class I SAM-dependent methyltransferase n=1 Tax=Polynucleobacter sp. MWH-Berg-3C6 TaxID=1855882 RepID=UPI001C0B9BF2|nr:class I SAM-dependent methyltransferase [Polynucleobacter sp. MWH-Berg-3C6]MBU3549913.1 methyltransferase domain-containing protein [Polynucleobacter sp. MWH-Berg-3C6]
MTTSEDSLLKLQETIYFSSNYTRRRLHQIRLRWVSAAIKAYAPQIPISRAIEYGPGSGIYLGVLAEDCADVIGADIEPAYLSGIERLLDKFENLQILVDDIQESKLEDASFGLVLCTEVLEHVPSPELALHTLYRILRPGGILILTTPQRFSFMELFSKIAFLPGVIQLVRQIYREPILEMGHISLRTATELRTSIADCGFEFLSEDKFGLYLPFLAEFGGAWGGRRIATIERLIKSSPLNWVLWTQAYILRKPI